MTEGWNRRQFGAGMLAGAMLAVPAAPVLAKPGIARSRWQPAGLAALRRRATELGVRALVVTDAKGVILSEGAVSESSRIASVRKSLLSALYGMAAAEGRIRLGATLGELGVEDYTKLTPAERGATVRDLLKARSGIYLPTSAETPAMKAARPARGSHPPGSFWYYNNWDFNVLGEIYQRMTGEGLFAAVEHRLAKPLGWQDFDPLQHARWSYDAENPRFPAYNIWLSARDLARFGQLFLNRGRWQGRQLVPEAWIDESTAQYSTTGRAGWGGGYGYMWWLATDQGADPQGLPVGSFTAAGNGGRYITVFPREQIVVAVQPDEQQGKPAVPLYADPDGYTDLLRLILAAVR
ncbi:serine hydrolase [Brevundimonas diminuta]|uniref:serine hydrolase domain-containing protein n=1 Tax=Brevundimonas diminuta TaxID=293 RepID=UPI0030F7240A